MCGEKMAFPDTVEEFMDRYRMVDLEHVYSNEVEYVPIFRMKQWFEHINEAAPVRRGRWLVTPYTEYDNTYKCSVCSMEWAFLEGEPKDNGANYCPNCGAKMED